MEMESLTLVYYLSVANKSDCILAFMRLLGDQGLSVTMNDEIEHMKGTFDAALSKRFAKMKSQGVGASTWLTAHMSQRRLVMDMNDLDAVVAAGDNLQGVTAQLSRLIVGSRTGEAV